MSDLTALLRDLDRRVVPHGKSSVKRNMLAEEKAEAILASDWLAEHDRQVRETIIDWMVEEARLLLKSDYLAAHGHEALDEVRRRAHANFGVPLPNDQDTGGE